MGERQFLYMPHTHWEGAVFKTREEYLSMGLSNILRALRLLEQYPHYRFVLDQSCYVEPFLRRFPEAAEVFRRHVQDGRLAIVGGTHVMHDGNMPGPESLVRQIQYGREFFRRELGVDVAIAWQLDTFGHHAQTPQLLRLAGYQSFWFFRGVPSWETSAEFFWEGIDGTRIPAYWLPHGYAIAYGSPADREAFAAFMRERFDSLEPFTDSPVRAGPAGADVSEPEEHVPPLVEALAAEKPARDSVAVRIALPDEYEAVVQPTANSPIVRGELNPIFQGAYSSRIELKQFTRRIETLLTDAEMLGALLTVKGVEGHADPLWSAWEPMLFNQAHDLMSGVMTDHVYADTLASYEHSERIANEALNRRLDAYGKLVDTRGTGVPVVVVNTLPWNRTDVVWLEAGFPSGDWRGVRVLGPDGRPVPVQALEVRSDRHGKLVAAKLAFRAQDVPAIGHSVYHVVPCTEELCVPDVEDVDAPVAASTDRLRASFDPKGAMTGLALLPEGTELLGGPGNVIAQERDEGDFWEPYRPLDGGSRIAMHDRHPVAPSAVLSTDARPESMTIQRGTVYTEVRIRGNIGEGTFATTVRVVDGTDRVDIRTTLVNREKFVRYRVLFPTSMRSGVRYDEIPFGAIERPDGIEFPAQNWCDWGSPTHGLALLNRGIPGNNVAHGMLMLSLARATRIVAYGFGGGYEPGMTSDTGFELDKALTLEYALVPHRGDWRTAQIHRRGQEFQHPLLIQKEAQHEGILPAVYGWIEPLDSQLMMTSLQANKDDVVMRLYEATGQQCLQTAILPRASVSEAWEVNLLHDPMQELKTKDGAVLLDFAPYQIRTVALRPRRAHAK